MLENIETRTRILDAAKQEFLLCGYEKASLRTICKNAKTTTGSAYFFFKDKNDIFYQLVGAEAEKLLSRIKHLEGENLTIREDETYSFEMGMSNQLSQIKTILEHMYDHKDIYTLLWCHASGSCMENFFDEVVNAFEILNRPYIEERQKAGIIDVYFDDDTLHNLISLQISAIIEPLRHDLPRELAMKQIEAITQFCFGGWNAVLKFKL